jgi:hypothetical protein
VLEIRDGEAKNCSIRNIKRKIIKVEGRGKVDMRWISISNDEK